MPPSRKPRPKPAGAPQSRPRRRPAPGSATDRKDGPASAAARPAAKGRAKAASRPRPQAAEPTAPETTPVRLSATQRRYLRGLSHDLHPVIRLGNKGATDAVIKELGLALDHHELVKVKLSGGDRDERQRQIAALVEGTGAASVQQIGHTVAVYRRNTRQPKLALPR